VTSGVVRMEFSAMTLNAAILTATERWRLLSEDPSATLPWTAHFEFFEEPRADDGSEQMVKVTIEFDRKIVDELTGVTTAQST
jgi:hypothetical protein